MKTEHEINDEIARINSLIKHRIEFVKKNPRSPSCRHLEDTIKQLYREIELLEWILS